MVIIMTLNILICFFLTLMLISGLYKRITIKALIKGFNSQSEYSSFMKYGIDVSDYYPFKRWKFFRLERFVNSKFYIKFTTKIYLFQVLLSIAGFTALLIGNYFDKYNILSLKW